MAKKQKEETTNVNATANRDIIQRLNFLYQASIYLQSVTPSTSSDGKGKGRQFEEKSDIEPPETMDVDAVSSSGSIMNSKSKSKKVQRTPGTKKTTGDLARTYVHYMRVVGQKTTVKIDPCLKRSLCSNCSSTLIPGSSASIRVNRSPNHGHIMIYTCLHCRTKKRIPAPPNSLQKIPQTSVEPTKPAANLSGVSSPSELMPLSDEHVSKADTIPKTKRRSLGSKPLPLFARPNAGHVIFSGNERLGLDEESGLGVLFS